MIFARHSLTRFLKGKQYIHKKFLKLEKLAPANPLGLRHKKDF